MTHPLDPAVLTEAFDRAISAAATAQAKSVTLDDIVAPAMATFVGWLRTTPAGQAWLMDQALRPALDRLAQGLAISGREAPPLFAPKPAKPRKAAARG